MMITVEEALAVTRASGAYAFIQFFGLLGKERAFLVVADEYNTECLLVHFMEDQAKIDSDHLFGLLGIDQEG